jgi:two-component system, chemotaxis family, chemotaxis protein CheY
MSKSLKILVVDDFQVVRMVIKKLLKELGMDNIEEAADGRIALQMIEKALSSKKPYDVIFCDWNMPDVSGLQVIEICRQRPELKDLPIVLITAEGDSNSIDKAMNAGATDYLLKPFVPAVLQHCISQIIAKVNAA